MDTRTDAPTRAGLAAIALSCAREAGALVSAGYRSRPRVDLKAANDLVTDYDRASEELLVSRLGSLTPDIPIVAEEGGGTGASQQPLVWYVDPLDGTTNFAHGHPFWCVAIGLLDNDVPVVGAVVAPSLGIWWLGWHAGAERVATRNDAPCDVSGTDRLADSLIATGFPAARDRHPDDNFASFVSVKRAARAVRRCGSAAIDLCLVADGTYDGYWERRLSAWDVVAGSALVIAAGGHVTSLEGGAPEWTRGHVVASNGRIHGELIDAVKGGVRS